MTSMIEHACGQVLDELNDRGLLKGVDDDLFDEIGKAVARRVITAMREPTEAMTNEWPHAHAHLIEGHWRRAIDAALKPEGQP